MKRVKAKISSGQVSQESRHLLKEFIQREKDYLRAGGKFIVPLPQSKIISRKDL